MLPRTVIRQIRRLHLRAKRAVEDMLGGEYHSVFKGAGIAFEEVREYTPGDDVRTIDWNVTARMGHPYIKRFVEERELTLMLLLDVSPSVLFASRSISKLEVAMELAAIVALSALNHNDKVGLIVFDDEIRRVVPPRKGTRHIFRLLAEMLQAAPRSGRGQIEAALDLVNRILHRRAVVFLFSDFLTQAYTKRFKQTAKRHDLVAVRIVDPWERELPDLGLVRWEDAETGEQLIVDTSNPRVYREFRHRAEERDQQLKSLVTSAGADLIEALTDGSAPQALWRFYQRRERRLRRV